MNRLTSMLLGTALALAFAAAPQLALAQPASNVIEEVVVTARQREETAQSVPIPITALTSEELETRSLRDVTDIERLTPSTDITNSSINSTATQVFIRGIGQVNWSSTQDPKIGIYVDGVYLSRPQGGLLDLMDVQRVEVLRGPQGTLFGRNTAAGLIHLITNAPNKDEQEFDVHAGAGEDGHLTYGIVYNQPASDAVALRFAAYHKEADGTITNAVTGEERGNEDATSYRFSITGEKSFWDMRFTYDHFEADESAALGSCRFTGPDLEDVSPPHARIPFPYLPAVAYDFGIYQQQKDNCEATTRDRAFDHAMDESATTDVDSFALHQNFDIEGVGVITAISSYREIENFNGSWGWGMGAGMEPNTTMLEVLNNEGEHEIFSQEIRLAGSDERLGLDWVVGLYYFEEDSYETLDVPLFRGTMAPTEGAALAHFAAGVPDGEGGTVMVPNPMFDSSQSASMTNPAMVPLTHGARALGYQLLGSRSQAYDATNKNQAFFAEATYAVTDEFSITAGFRYIEDDREFTRIQTLYGGAFDPGYGCPGNIVPTTAGGTGVAMSDRCTQEVEYDETTPRLILSYQLTDDVMLYGGYSVGYASGGFNQDVRMRPFLPETSDNIEFGVKSTAYDGKMLLNATLFHNIYDNQQITVGRLVDGQPTADVINAQEAVISGVEFELQARMTDTFSVLATGSYVRGDYKEFTTEDNVVRDGMMVVDTIDQLDRGVEFGTVGGEFSFDLALMQHLALENGTLSWTAGFSFKDETYYSLEQLPSSRADSYWLVDARLTYTLPNEQTSFSLWSTNLLDETYIDNMISQSGTLETDASPATRDYSQGMTALFWGDPRRAGLEFRHRF